MRHRCSRQLVVLFVLSGGPSLAAAQEITGADVINAFNQVQFDPATIQNTCNSGADLVCTAAPTSAFGQLTGTRAPREIQLGFRVMWR